MHSGQRARRSFHCSSHLGWHYWESFQWGASRCHRREACRLDGHREASQQEEPLREASYREGRLEPCQSEGPPQAASHPEGHLEAHPSEGQPPGVFPPEEPSQAEDLRVRGLPGGAAP
jgi:hypothetical protein